MSASISFDRAVEYYDETRQFPPGVAQAVAASLARALPPSAAVLEIGVGTGRISGPLLQEGLHITGIDISRRMMERFAQRAASQPARPCLIEGSAASLPLLSGRFEAVVAVHVLHLIPEWQQAILEVRRVLKPGGALWLGNDQRDPDDPQSVIRKQLDALLKARGYSMRHSTSRDFSEVKAFLASLGASYQERDAAQWTAASTPAAILAQLEARVWSSSWQAPEELYGGAMLELRQWAAQAFVALDREMPRQRKFTWQCFSF